MQFYQTDSRSQVNIGSYIASNGFLQVIDSKAQLGLQNRPFFLTKYFFGNKRFFKVSKGSERFKNVTCDAFQNLLKPS